MESRENKNDQNFCQGMVVSISILVQEAEPGEFWVVAHLGCVVESYVCEGWGVWERNWKQISLEGLYPHLGMSYLL